MKEEKNKEPIVCFNLFPLVGASIDFIDCIHCGFRNIINCEYYGPKKRLSSVECMECGQILACPDCENKLREGLITERDAILKCSCDSCGFWVNIW